jgi:hypothetical protein
MMLSQLDLIVGVLQELERQCPGAYMTQDAMNALIIAVDLIIEAQKYDVVVPDPDSEDAA